MKVPIPSSMQLIRPYVIDGEQIYVMKFDSILKATSDTLEIPLVDIIFAKVNSIKINCLSTNYDVNLYGDVTKILLDPNDSTSLYYQAINKFKYESFSDIKVRNFEVPPVSKLYINLKNSDAVNDTGEIYLELGLVNIKY